jgi:hypothetical protein
MEENLKTQFIAGTDIECGHVLIGSMGGQSNVYEVEPSSSIPGLLAVETEHGFLYLDPDCEYEVLVEKSI